MHVHVLSGKGEAKFWLEPEVSLVKSHRYESEQLTEIKSIIENHHEELVSAWRRHFDR